MTRSSHSSSLLVLCLAFAACALAACNASLGPGYIVEKQEIRVSFDTQPQPLIHVDSEYHLKNTGIQTLDSLDVRLPGPRFHLASLAVSWDGDSTSQSSAEQNPRDTLIRFPQPWAISDSHTLKVSYDIRSTSAQPDVTGFSADGFFLPAEGWTPALPQERGVFGFGGVPPDKWQLAIKVPSGFEIHASGRPEKRSGKNAESEFRFQQTVLDLTPFVVAGRYQPTHLDLAHGQRVNIWSRAALNSAESRRTADSLSKTLASYDSLFGPRGKTNPPLWIVECPAPQGCFSQRSAIYSSFLYGHAPASSAEMISRDTVLVDSSAPAADRQALAGPALAAGWLGYGQNPGFYEQGPPMSALPAFATALARESASGPQVREEIIQRALARIPAHPGPDSNSDPVIARAKGLLLFYALRERVGPQLFQKALQHMLSARQGRGFDITDLISSLEQESHQTVGPFVREWLKRPGVPQDFRAKYAQSAAQQFSNTQEAAK